MKVLHLIGGGDVGGAKFHVLSLVKELSRYIDVKIISFRYGQFADDGKAMGIDMEVVQTGSLLNDVKRVVQIIKCGSYNIVHSHGAKANMVSALVKRFTGVHTVTTVHSDYRLDYLESIYKAMSFGVINTLALRFIDYHIGVSDNYKKMLIARRFKSKNIFTVYNGIDFDTPMPHYTRAAFSDKYGMNLKEDDIVVGILARLDPVKGIDIFLKAAKLVLEKNPSVKFIIGGDGKERKNLENKAAELGITRSVLFPGWINDRYEFMSSIDINVLTSLSESFPFVILEGTRFKKATVSSNVGGVADLIDSGVNGFLFNVGDHIKLSEHLLTLVSNNQVRLEMGEKIYTRAKEQFSLTNMCSTQLEIYNKIMKIASSNSSSYIKKYSYDVMLSGYYGFKNSGDDAILKAIIHNLRILKPDIRIVVLSKNPSETREIYDVDSISRLNLFKIINAMRNLKLFVNGGGNLMQDDTSTRSLMYYLGVTWLAKRMRAKVMVYANGIGPINKSINRKIAKRILNQVNTITLREKLSEQELSKLGIDKPEIIVTADPALTVEAVTDSQINDIFDNEGLDLSGPFVAFSVRQWEYQEHYEKVIAEAADYMVEKYGVKPVFIPMHYPMDLNIINNIVAKMKHKGYIITRQYDVAYILGIIKRMDMLVGMRLHSLIYAASLGIPVVGLVYEPKIEAFLEYFHQASAGHVKDLSFGKIIAVMDDVWSKRTDIKKHLKKITVELKEKAFENAKIAIDLIDSNKH